MYSGGRSHFTSIFDPKIMAAIMMGHHSRLEPRSAINQFVSDIYLLRAPDICYSLSIQWTEGIVSSGHNTDMTAVFLFIFVTYFQVSRVYCQINLMRFGLVFRWILWIYVFAFYGLFSCLLQNL